MGNGGLIKFVICILVAANLFAQTKAQNIINEYLQDIAYSKYSFFTKNYEYENAPLVYSTLSRKINEDTTIVNPELLILSAKLLYFLEKYDSSSMQLQKAFKARTGKNRLVLQNYIQLNFGIILIINSKFRDAEDYLKSARDYFSTVDDSAGLSHSYYYLGVVYKNMGRLTKAIKYLNLGYTIMKNANDSLGIAKAVNLKGLVNKNIGNYERALEYYFESIDIAIGQSDKKLEAKNLNNIGVVLRKVGQKDQAYKKFIESLRLNKEIEFKMGIAKVYYNIGNYFKAMETKDSAFAYYSKSIEIIEHLENNEGFAHVYAALGTLFLSYNEVEVGLEYLERAYDLSSKFNDVHGIISVEIDFAIYYRNLGRFDKSIELLKKALNSSIKNNFSPLVKSACYELFVSYSSISNYKTALSYYQQFVDVSEELLDESRNVLVADMLTNFTLQEKQRKIDLLEKEKRIQRLKLSNKDNIQLLLVVIVFLSILIVVFIWNRFNLSRRINYELQSANSTLKEREQQLETALSEKELLLKEVYHRIKNSLQVVSSMLSLQKNRAAHEETKLILEESRSRINSISLVHKKLYNSSNLSSVKIKDYLISLVDELVPAYNAEIFVSIEYDIDDTELEMNFVIPIGIITNELVTNSIKYAFPGNREGKILISLKRKDSHVIFNYSDNGIGFSADTFRKEKKGLGITIIETLIDQLSCKSNFQTINGFNFTFECDLK